MARKGRVDRGLYQRFNAEGKPAWYVRVVENGKQQRFGAFPTKTEARNFYDKVKREQAEQRFDPQQYRKRQAVLGDLIDQHLAVCRVQNLDTEKYYGRWWKARLQGIPLSGVTPGLVETIQEELLAKGFKPQTVVHYLKFLRHVLNKAVKNGILSMNPFARVKLVKIPQRCTRFLSLKEESQLSEQLGETYRDYARLAILTGLRLSEQFSMKWEWVDFERGMITLPQTKAGVVQYVRLNAEAKAILRAWQTRHLNTGGCGVWVFPSGNPDTHLDQRNFTSRIFLPAMKRANLQGVTWHTLRHTYASRLAMCGQSDRTIASLLRHSGTGLVQRYAHLSPTHLQEAVESVGTFGQGRDFGTDTKIVNGGGREEREIV
ncbi:MAG: hypothetical protein NPIRA05_00900 [Nitrospirales bacterium]|nr:MAG: hypothetical protein NPIRA05_00900 [Nitrospirales bacterium]